MSERNEYRPEIDGLRTIAVLAVVINHVHSHYLPGGFLGVDIFFVISGYLISKIINYELAAKKFTFVNFYERRIRRIVPALFFTLFFVFILGYFILLPSDYIAAARGVFGGVTFTANIIFWRYLDTGYFAAMEAAVNPVTHLWSLSVEEQFYIFFPLLAMLFARCSSRVILLITVILIGLSIALEYFVNIDRPVAAFFLTPFRGWELLIGALAFYLKPLNKARHLNSLGQCLGIVLITWAYIFTANIRSDIVLYQLIAVMGAFLIIYCRDELSIVSRFLSLEPIVLIGKSSYSLYLFHWPILVFFSYVGIRGALNQYIYLIFVLTLCISLALFSLIYVERPFRFNNFYTRKKIYINFISGSIVLAALSLLTIYANGLSNRFNKELVDIDKARFPDGVLKECDGLRDVNKWCHIGVANIKPTYLIIGDSHSVNWGPYFDEILRKNNKSAIYAPQSACPPLLIDARLISSRALPGFCGNRSSEIEQFVKSGRVKNIVLVGNWFRYFNHYESDQFGFHQISDVNPEIMRSTFIDSINYYHSKGLKISILGPVPIYERSIPFAHAQNIMFGVPISDLERDRNFYTKKGKLFYELISEFTRTKKIEYFDLLEKICPINQCLTITDGVVLYQDSNHVNANGIDVIKSSATKIFD